jgi:hypothetical protein
VLVAREQLESDGRDGVGTAGNIGEDGEAERPAALRRLTLQGRRSAARKILEVEDLCVRAINEGLNGVAVRASRTGRVPPRP